MQDARAHHGCVPRSHSQRTPARHLLSKRRGYRAIASGRVRFMGTPELIMVAIVVLVLFGGSQLPKLAKNLGSAQRELKKAMEEGKSEGDSSESK